MAKAKAKPKKTDAPAATSAGTFTTMDFGQHNADLMKTADRLMKGASWKRQSIIMVIPAGAKIDSKVYLSHRSLIFPPNQAMVPILAEGFEVGEAYSQAISNILAHPDLSKFDYLLTVEHDNIPPPDGVLKLLARMEENQQYACIGGLYFCKGPGGCAHLWGAPDLDPVVNYRPQVPRPGELMETYGNSMGFHLWRLAMFKDERLPRPFFQTKAGLDGVGTQDLAFWSSARKLGYRTAVDCGCLVGHYDGDGKFGPPGMVW